METIKKFYYMDVYNRNGKKLGYIQDIGLNFHTKKIEFFSMMPKKILSKPQIFLNKDVVCFSHNMIIEKSQVGLRYGFRSIKNIPVENFNGKLIGTVEDVVIDCNLNLLGIYISPGIIKKYYKGLTFLFISDIIIENKKVYYMRNQKDVEFKTTYMGGDLDDRQSN